MSNKPTRMVLVTNNAERAAVVEQVAAQNGWQLLPCVRRPVPFELLDHLRIDLFLVDLELENAFEQVKELSRRPSAKVIVLASAEQMGRWNEAMQIGAKELISLPIEPQHLINTITQLVNGGGNNSFMAGHAQAARPATSPFSHAHREVTPPPASPSHSNGMQNRSAAEGLPPVPPPPARPMQGPPTVLPQQPPPMGFSNGPSNGAHGQPPLPAQQYTAPSYQQPVPPPPAQSVAPANYAGPAAPNGNGAQGYANGYGNGYQQNNGYPQNNGHMPQGLPPNGYPSNGYASTPANRLIAVTGLRGGVGRSTIAVNLAVALRQRSNANVILAEAHHGLGHAALLMNMLPRHTLASLTEGDAFDTDIMRSVLQQHSSGVQLFSAPLDVAQLVEFSPESWRNILTLLKQLGQYVVVDTSAYTDSVLSEVLTAADEIIMVCGPDILSMRSTMSLLETLRSERDNVRGRVQLVLNRSGVRGGLEESTLQKQLREKISVSFTDDAPLATYALNRGVPFVLSHARSALTRSIQTLVDQFHVAAPSAAAPAKKPFALLPLLSRG